jgi:hypothetical protein
MSKKKCRYYFILPSGVVRISYILIGSLALFSLKSKKENDQRSVKLL